MTERLKDHVAIVTGAADGIGHAIAELFCKQGANVCVADINETLGADVVNSLDSSGYDAIFVKTDVSNASSVAAMVAETMEKLGQPSILVNNVGLLNACNDVLETSDEQWKRSFAVNVDGMWNCCREVLPLMKEANSGSIVNVGSVHSFQILPHYFPYAVTKHAVIGLTRNLAVEYGEYNIRINALCPGMVETPTAFKVWSESPDPEAARAATANIHPLKKNGTTEDIAYAALFLASNESRFITGQSLIVDGGRSVLYHD